MPTAVRSLSLAVMTAASVVVIPPTASAQEAPGMLTMHSDAGDFIGQGRDYNYTRPFDQVWANVGFNQSFIHLTVNGLNGDQWTLDFAAPDNQPLQVGEYVSAQGWPFQETGHPGLQVNQGFICQTITGTFTVLDLAYVEGSLSRFHATFEQHCDGAAAALTGEIVFTPPPPLPALQFTISVDRFAAVTDSGAIVLTGTITCNQYVWASVSVSVTQGSNLTGNQGSFSCAPETRVPWRLFASAEASLFRLGQANVAASTSGQDGYTGTIEGSQTARAVVLRRG